MYRRIVIVGFMGCGKTTVARTLARQMGYEMIDLDSFITARQGRSPAEIIAQDGEPSFRKVETSALEEVLEKSDARVIALGGGAWIVEANRALLETHNCVSVWLDAPFALCWQRIMASDTVRPMAPDRSSAERLFCSRAQSYRLADIRLDASSTKSLNDTVTQLASSLRLT
jgi:shikimate kinase